MNFLRKLFGKKQFDDHEFRFRNYEIAGITPISWEKDYHSGRRYEIYRGRTRSVALEFLKSIPITEIPGFVYIIVKTPQGTIGKGLIGIFDEATGDIIESSSQNENSQAGSSVNKENREVQGDVRPLPDHQLKLLSTDSSQLKKIASQGKGFQMVEVDTMQMRVISQQELEWAVSVTSLADEATNASNRGDYGEALRLYLEAYKQAPAYPLIPMSIGTCYANLGDLKKAIQYLEESHRLAPNDERIARNLAAAKEMAG